MLISAQNEIRGDRQQQTSVRGTLSPISDCDERIQGCVIFCVLNYLLPITIDSLPLIYIIIERVSISKVYFCKRLYIFTTNSLPKNEKVGFVRHESDTTI